MKRLALGSKKPVFIILVVLMFCLWVSVAFGQEKKQPLLIVLPLTANGVDQEVAASLGDLLVSEFEKAQLYEVVAQDDLKAMLSQVELKQLMGVESDKELAAVGERLKSDFLLRGSVGLVGNTYLVSLTLLDVKNAVVIRRVNQTVAGEPQDLIGSLHAAVVALALEEEGHPPRITAQLVESLNISRKRKTLFVKFMAGYEMPVGPVVNDATVAYILPGMMRLSLSAGYHVLPWMQLVFESGAALSIMEDFGQQTKLNFKRNYGQFTNPNDPDDVTQLTFNETIVNSTHFDYSTVRVPLNVMVRFQPKSGRLLPYFQLGLGMSWQRYSLGDESAQPLYSDVGTMVDNNATCPYEYVRNDAGNCVRDLTLTPENDTIDYINLNVPIGAGVDYLLTHNIGISFEARYLLTYILNKSGDDINPLFSYTDTYNTPAGTPVFENPYVPGATGTSTEYTEKVGDAHPIRRTHHGISVMVGAFYYF